MLYYNGHYDENCDGMASYGKACASAPIFSEASHDLELIRPPTSFPL